MLLKTGHRKSSIGNGLRPRPQDITESVREGRFHRRRRFAMLPWWKRLLAFLKPGHRVPV